MATSRILQLVGHVPREEERERGAGRLGTRHPESGPGARELLVELRCRQASAVARAVAFEGGRLDGEHVGGVGGTDGLDEASHHGARGRSLGVPACTLPSARARGASA